MAELVGSQYGDEGWSPVEIAARLGHSKATVATKRYARGMVGRDLEIAKGLDQLHAGVSRDDVARGLHAGDPDARETGERSG